MGMRDMIEEWVGTLLAVGRVKDSAIAGSTEPTYTIVGDEAEGGDEEHSAIEQFTTAPLSYRPLDPDADADGTVTGAMEAIFIRWDDDRVVIGTKDRRYERAPEKGEVILHALGDDGTEQARISLKKDGSVTVTADTVNVVADNVNLGSSSPSQYVAYRSDLEGLRDEVTSKFNAHTHIENGGVTDAPAPVQQMSYPGALGSSKVHTD